MRDWSEDGGRLDYKWVKRGGASHDGKDILEEQG